MTIKYPNSNKRTSALAAAGLLTLTLAATAEETPNQVLTALSSTTLSGYVGTSAVWMPGDNDGSPRLPGYSFMGGKMDGFNLDAVKLSIGKPVDEGQWSAGYTVDLLYGPDATGFNTSIGAASGDFSIEQAKVTLRAPVGNGLDITMGVFSTIIGYEVFSTVDNPNWSRSLGYFIEPTQHTGVLLSYEFNEVVAVSAGVANTYTAGINDRIGTSNGAADESEKTLLGSISLTAPESMGWFAGASAYFGVVYGAPGGYDATTDTYAGAGEQTSYYLGLGVPLPTDRVTLGLALDYSDYKSGYASAYAGYLGIAATDKLTFNTRVDYGRSNAGAFGTGISDEEILALTETIDYALFDNVTTRLELRYDVDLEDTTKDANGNSGAFGGSDEFSDDSFWVALNVIYVF